MTSTTSFETSPIVDQVRKSALSRWKLETLTGLLGIKALQSHQAETEKNVQAENQRIRKDLWGYQEPQEGEDVNSQTILGDVTHPTPIIINGQQSSGLGKLLAGAALGATLLGIPAAGIGGYLASQLLKPATTETTAPEDQTLDLGLLRFEDLEPKEGTQK
jgi:hypothetical protein